MKILLIYPTTMDNGRPNKYRKAFIPPLNMAILDRLTHKTHPKHDIKIVNDVVEEIDFNIDCDLVGITALTAQAPRAYQIADMFRNRGTPVVLGGIHPSMCKDEASQHADAVVMGEAENVWNELIADAEKAKLKPIYRDNEYPDLKQLLIPKWDNMDLSIYRRSYGRKYPRMPIYTTRGCVHNCKFCSVTKFFGQKYRYKPIENVLEEIKLTKAESYFFTDDNIICKPSYSKELFKCLKSNTSIRWLSQCSTSILNKPELIALAAQAGCKWMFFGAESINKANLQKMNKSFNDPEKLVELHRRCLESGIQPMFSLIFGFDHDMIINLWDTVKFLKKNKIWNVVFWLLTPLPGTDLFHEMVNKNRMRHFDWAKYDLNHVVFNPLNFSADSLYIGFWNLYKSHYSHANIFTRLFYKHKFDNFFKYYITFLTNQYYSRRQVLNNNHPFSMGISKIDERTAII